MIITDALASTATTATSTGSFITSLVPLVLIFVVFYFLVIRPQQKKLKDHNKMIEAITRGDKVSTSGGIIGIVSRIDKNNNLFFIEIANNVEVKIIKSAISEVLEKKNN